MSQAHIFWTIWLALLKPFAWAHFTRIGFGYFVEWITALALLIEEHTVTGSVTAMDRPADWRRWSDLWNTAPGTTPPLRPC